MSFFRSETMAYYQIIIPRETAWYALNQLASLSCIQIVDMTPQEAQMSRPYYPIIRRCDEILSQISHFEQQMTNYRVRNQKLADYGQFIQHIPGYSASQQQPEDKWLEVIEANLDYKYSLLVEQLRNLENIQNRRNQLFEYKAVLFKSKETLGTNYSKTAVNVAVKAQVGKQSQAAQHNPFSLSYLVGVIDKDDAIRFKRLVFRASKGNCWIDLSDIEYKKEKEGKGEVGVGVLNPRSVFIIMYQGGNSDFLKSKLNRICDSFDAAKFTLPDDPSRIMDKVMEKDKELDEIVNLVSLTENKIKEILLSFADTQQPIGCSLLELYRLLILKDKLIYHNLNCLHMRNTVFGGFFWAPKAKENEISQKLKELSLQQKDSAPVQFIQLSPDDNMTVPTYFKINEFTWAFQEIVNTYGIPRYKEINPGLFAVMFFPFMFGIMFGDIGHGGVLLLISIFIVLKSDKLRQNPENQPIILARYLFLLMGFCAVYCGFIYNDFMSMPFNLFGSCYQQQENSLQTTKKENCIYPFGLDPVWYISSNELMFFNSFKMKFAVIYGVSQMLFGIILKGLNAIYFRSAVDFFFEFIPQILFMSCTFGYMITMIIIKWNIDWSQYGTDYAPSIITIMINIALKSGDTEGKPLWDAQGQQQLSHLLLMIAIVCVPWMLIPKPFILKWKNDSKEKHKKHAIEEVNQGNEPLLQQEINVDENAEEIRKSLIKKQQEKQEQLQKIKSKKIEEVHEEHQTKKTFVRSVYSLSSLVCCGFKRCGARPWRIRVQ